MTRSGDLAVVVTGASSGIGYATARAFSAVGARTLLVGRDDARLQDAAEHIPGSVEVVADVTDPAGVERIVSTATAALGGIDVLVNNAGAFATAGLRDVDLADLDALLQTNIVAPVTLTQAALGNIEERQGAIVNVTSTYGHRPAPGASVYAASKAALESLTRSWALELAPRAIRVNAIAPGPTETPILRRSGLSADEAARHEQVIAEQVPLRRLAHPDEIASTAVHLALHPYITGETISVDGGLSVA